MRFIDPIPALLTGQHRDKPCGVHHPSGRGGVLTRGILILHVLEAPWIQLNPGRPGFAPNLRAFQGRQSQDFLIHNSAIQLIRRQSHLVFPSNLAAFRQSGGLVIGEPKAHPLFHQMGFVQMAGQTEDASEEKRADFDGGFADASGEARGFLEDQDPEVGTGTSEQEGSGRAGQRAAQHDDIPFARL